MLSMIISPPVRVIMRPTQPPAMGSKSGKPAIARDMPTMATTDDMASERWCQALAMTVWLLACSPARMVMRKSSSLSAIEARLSHKAATPGTAGAKFEAKVSRT